MSELMGSARLGYAGDAVLLYREMTNKEVQHYYGLHSKEAAEKRRAALNEQGVALVMLILEKGRDGMLRGKWGVEFHYRKSTFREIEPGKKGLPVCLSPKPDKTSDDGEAQPSTNGAAAGSLPLPPPGPGGKSKVKANAKTSASPAKKQKNANADSEKKSSAGAKTSKKAK
jgi:hypothetical protein